MGMYKIHTEADLTLAEYKRREYRPVKVVRRTLYVLAGALLPSGLIVLEFEPWSERTNWLAGLAALVLFVGIEVSLLFGAYRSLARLISRLLGVTTLTAAFITMITGLCLIVRSPSSRPGLGLLLIGFTGSLIALGMLIISNLRRAPGYHPLG
jgi:hypothetical protein